MPMIHVNGVDLHYHVQGKGTAIVFLHPPCLGSRMFTYLRNDLSQDHRTLLFDFRGHGRSGTSGTRLSIPLLAEDTRRLMDVLDIPAAFLFAYSFGSMVALEALLAYPDRFRGAMLMNGLAEAAGPVTGRRLKWAGLAAKFRAKDMLAIPRLWVNSDNIQTYRRLRGEMLAGDVRKWRDYLESARRYSAVHRLPEIKHPVLLLCGEHDEEFKPHARVLQQGLQNDSTAYVAGVKRVLPTYGADSAGPLVRGWLYAQEGVRAEERRNEGTGPYPASTLDPGAASDERMDVLP